jgi:hypothetical protein
MSTYTGLATLVLADGTREQGVVALRSERARPGQLRSWSGTFRPDNPSADLVNSLGANVPIELPIGETGEVLLQGMEGTGQDSAIRLVGTGPQPF